MVERIFIRVMVALDLFIAVIVGALVPIPLSAMGHHAVPSIALEQVSLYRLEVALLVFYGGLLLITPAFSGLARGRLPIEISPRGAKFAEEMGQTTHQDEAAIRELEGRFDEIADGLSKARVKIERLEGQVTVRDGE